MTAKEFVLKRYPNAYADTINTDMVIIMSSGASMSGYDIGRGLSEKRAWINARKRILEAEKSTSQL